MEFAAISFVFSLAIQLQVCLVALERVDVDNIVLHAPEQYHVACGKVSPVADLKQRKQKQAVSWKGGGKRHCLLYRNP